MDKAFRLIANILYVEELSVSQIKGEKWTLFLNEQFYLLVNHPVSFCRLYTCFLLSFRTCFFCLPMKYFAIGGYLQANHSKK